MCQPLRRRPTPSRRADGAGRRRDDNCGRIRSNYIHRFGTVAGSLDGHELTRAAGVMEHHSAVW